MNKSPIIPWIIASIMATVALLSTVYLIHHLENNKESFYQGQYEVLREIKNIYMPAPIEYGEP